MIATIESFFRGLPSGLFAVLVLAGGWIAAVLLRLLLWRFLELVRFNRLCERLGIAEFLRKGQARHGPSRLVGLAAYWTMLLVTLFQISRILDLKVVTSFSERLGAIVPGLLAGAFVGIIGLVVVTFIGNFVMTLARNAGFAHAGLLARAVKVAGYILVAGMALAELEIGRALVTTVLQILIGALAFGFALAFALGCKDMAREAATRWLHNLRERSRADGRSDLEG
jgi:hypothetical protein